MTTNPAVVSTTKRDVLTVIREICALTEGPVLADIDPWRVHDSNERPHSGHCDLGKRPVATFRPFVA